MEEEKEEKQDRSKQACMSIHIEGPIGATYVRTGAPRLFFQRDLRGRAIGSVKSFANNDNRLRENRVNVNLETCFHNVWRQVLANYILAKFSRGTNHTYIIV